MNKRSLTILLFLVLAIIIEAPALAAEYHQNTFAGLSWLIQSKLGNEYWGRSIPADAEIDELTNDDISPVSQRGSAEAAKALASYGTNSTDYQAVLQWLSETKAIATENLSRKILVLANAGKDVASRNQGDVGSYGAQLSWRFNHRLS